MQLQDVVMGSRYRDKDGAVCLVLAKHPEDSHVLVVEVEAGPEDAPALDYREPADFERLVTH